MSTRCPHEAMAVPVASPGRVFGASPCFRTLLTVVVLATFCLSIGNAMSSLVSEKVSDSGRRGWWKAISKEDQHGSTPSLQQIGNTEQISARQGKLADAAVCHDFDSVRDALQELQGSRNRQCGSEKYSKRLRGGDNVLSQKLKTDGPHRDLQSTERHDAEGISEVPAEDEARREESSQGGSDVEFELKLREQEGVFDPALLPDADHLDRQKRQDRSGRNALEDGGLETEDEKQAGARSLGKPYKLGPRIDRWDEQRGEWQADYPQWKSVTDTKPKVLLVSGSYPLKCRNQVADHFHIKTLKQKIDYARIHNYDFYYNFVYIDPQFVLYWAKLPVIRKLMLTHPEIEWFFWVDSDAVITDVLFEAPWDTYEGYDLVLWGSMDVLLRTKHSKVISDSAFLIRNSQWSLDLIDKWSPFGPNDLRDDYGDMLSAVLTGRIEGSPSDPQSALAYLILNDYAVRSKVKLVDSSQYLMSAHWTDVQDTFEASMKSYHPGLGDWRWPWITHFGGCHLCSADEDVKFHDCLRAYDKALNFADNQVLAFMGFEHESLSSVNVTRVVRKEVVDSSSSIRREALD